MVALCYAVIEAIENTQRRYKKDVSAKEDSIVKAEAKIDNLEKSKKVLEKKLRQYSSALRDLTKQTEDLLLKK